MNRKSDSEKLGFVHGMLRGTIGSICDYSAEALIDRMKYIVAVVEDDEEGTEKFGQLCHNEREAAIASLPLHELE